eukprot:TRINITY_DN800_c0_g4_i7.p1 TRINITY_DN800_c0_g4~~TRINITY_DN800_c0_g4_i7.p1  ORF type:complete len:102 (-),score=9.17 TRINITY_DN800_c0_g4_i7:141-446(-)
MNLEVTRTITANKKRKDHCQHPTTGSLVMSTLPRCRYRSPEIIRKPKGGNTELAKSLSSGRLSNFSTKRERKRVQRMVRKRVEDRTGVPNREVVGTGLSKI